MDRRDIQSELAAVRRDIAAGDFRCDCTCEYEHAGTCRVQAKRALVRREGELRELLAEAGH